jgi:integrase
MANPEEPVSSESVAAVIDLFLDWTQAHREPETYKWYQKYLQSFLDSLKPKTLLVAKLKAHHVESWVDRHAWGDSSRRGAMTAVARCFNWAEKKGHINSNPIRRKLEKPPAGQRDRVVSQEEYDTLLTHLNPNLKDLLVTAWETGARPQEITRVEARHVDLQNGRWVFPVKESKGKKEKRIVYLSDAALEITKRLMDRFPEGPIFRNRLGAPWARFTVACCFDRLKEKVGVKYRLYDFRHSFCTHGLKNGVDPMTMAKLMGHSDLTMIHKIYSHISQDPAFMRKAAMQAAK